MVFFSGGKGGGEEVSYGYKGKGMTNHLLVDYLGNPLHITTTGADKDEREQVCGLLTTMEKPLRQYRLTGKTTILEADKGYDSRICRLSILAKKIFPFIPYREMGKGYEEKVGIRYLERKRWQCERAIAWLQRKYRRIVCRWERRIKFWKGFLNFALVAYWLFKISKFIG